jgi:hypothetical protein
MSDSAVIYWNEAGAEQSARWRSEKNLPPPKLVQVIDDRMPADTAYRLACEGTALLWRGDFQNARLLLQAMARRAEKKRSAPKSGKLLVFPAEIFHRYRQVQSQRTRTLDKLLIPFHADHSIPLRRAPDVRLACLEAYGPRSEAYITSLREYVELVAQTPLPDLVAKQSIAFDIGTGTGVLAAVLARRGVQRIIATDQDLRALDCARDNLTRLDLIHQIDVMQADLFPQGQAALIVCNPPWIPARPSSPLEHAIFDPDNRMLRGFLHGLSAHLIPGGEGWLILSDFAEHLALRTRTELLAIFDAAGLKVLSKSDVKPYHPRVTDVSDPLHAARAVELTSLWRLAAK